MKGENHVLDTVDWSSTGPWHQHRRLYGLNEFAGDITTLAMQKPGVNLKSRILPHHVFQLQCITDSLMASRGWSTNVFRGYVLTSRRPAPKFRPRRDVDLFLDREVERDVKGFLQSVQILQGVLNRDAQLQKNPNRFETYMHVLDDVKDDMINWLGESKYMYGLKTIPPSRFSKHNANGLWEYSPLLCGAGLVEGLVLVQKVIMWMWDMMPEPTLALHLHNMLVKKGYMKEVGLYATLEGLLEKSFFPDGIPDKDFHNAIIDQTTALSKDPATKRQRDALLNDPTKSIHDFLNVEHNRLFNTKSALMMYHDAHWLPSRVPDSAIRIPSMLYMQRLMETPRVIDPITKEKRLEETELIKRAKAMGMTDPKLLQAASISQPIISHEAKETRAMASRIKDSDIDGYTEGPHRDPYRVSQDKPGEQIQGRDLLNILRPDIFADVSGRCPISSLNYVLVTVNILILFMEIDDLLREARHPMWVAAYEDPEPRFRYHKRLAFLMYTMKEEDDEAMKLFAKAFEKCRVGMLSCIYWEDLQEGESGLKQRSEDDVDAMVDQCSVM